MKLVSFRMNGVEVAYLDHKGRTWEPGQYETYLATPRGQMEQFFDAQARESEQMYEALRKRNFWLNIIRFYPEI